MKGSGKSRDWAEGFPASMMEDALRAVTEPMNILDRDFRILWANEARARMHQRSLAEMIGQRCYEMFQRRADKCPDCPAEEAFQTGRPSVRERFAELPDGSRVWAESHAWPILDGEGRPTHVIQYARDITSRKRAELELRRSLKQLDAVASSIQEGLVVIERDYTISFVNQAYARQVDRRIEDILGQPCYLVSHGRTERCQAPDHPCPAQEVFATGRPHVALHRHTTSQGEALWVEVSASAVLDEEGRPARCVELVRDITETKKAQETLQRLKALNESVIQAIEDGLAALDEDLRITLWNKAMEKITGFSQTEALGRCLFEIFHHHSEAERQELLRTARRGRPASRLQTAFTTARGESRYLNERYLPLHAKDAGTSGTLLIVEDVTELHRLEERLERLQQEIRQRKIVEVAKGILMRELGLSEQDSYRLIQKRSQDERRKMADVARDMIELLGSPKERGKFD